MQYKNENLQEIVFPLGGIGSGCIGLAGNGRLVDWEIFNRPNKGGVNGSSHLAVKAKSQSGKTDVRILNGDLDKELTGQYQQAQFRGFGYGPGGETMCGFPHFSECTFSGQFPIAELIFRDQHFPGTVRLLAFNPFIPLDDQNSSIPAAFFEVCFENTTPAPIEYEAVFSVQNPFASTKNIACVRDGLSMIQLVHEGADKADPSYGDLTVACSLPNAVCQEYWYRGEWQDSRVTYWRELCDSSGLKMRHYDTPGCKDTCSIAGKVTVPAHGKKNIRFVLSWNVPNNYNYWTPAKDQNGRDITWKNYYAVLFADSLASAQYSLQNWDMLYKKTNAFRKALYSCTLDQAVLDAAGANLAVLKSPTVLRLEDGSFYGWEGVHEKTGSCEGTCQHVWNYAYALCFLFPNLERSIRDLEFAYEIDDTGKMDFRLKLPLNKNAQTGFACVDGQMGSVLKTYREWKISGDDVWLRGHWQTVKKILSYAWSADNPMEWDLDKDGVLEGRQHHTLDMELFGPSAWLEGFYLAALKAAAEMADYLGDCPARDEYTALFEKGAQYTSDHLFNGAYFIQKIDLHNKAILDHFRCTEKYWNSETKEIKYQIGEGCDIDQLCAQWHANILNLGNIFDKDQIHTALCNMYKNNFKTTMRDFVNPWRIFALNDEQGAVICDYPAGAKKPSIPIPYCEEAMHGFEYQLAGLLLSEGLIEEGLSVVRGVRDRYDGKKRNPWNEIECGSNYARSMASFALLPILSGFYFHMPKGEIGFDPIIRDRNFCCIWSLGNGWGTVNTTTADMTIQIMDGCLQIQAFRLPSAWQAVSLEIDGHMMPFTQEGNYIRFQKTIISQKLVIVL